MTGPTEVFPGVYRIGEEFATLSLAPGKRVYGEKVVRAGGKEYRVWNPYRSKLGAALKNGLKHMFIKPGSRVLYLGAAEGTTASHVADIVGEKGIVLAVDVSPRVMPKLIKVSEAWKNMVPILADARRPEEYKEYVGAAGGVDVVYEDVAQPFQTEILLKNVKAFPSIKYAYFAVKARSIDVTKEPEEVFREEERKLRREFEVLERIRLEPYEKDHIMFVLRRRT